MITRPTWMLGLPRAAVLASTLFVVASSSSAVAPTTHDHPVCIRVWGEARYRNFGYDHLVHVRNECAAPAICNVFTDVNPVRSRVLVPAGEEVEVLTHVGSPVSGFIAYAACALVL